MGIDVEPTDAGLGVKVDALGTKIDALGTKLDTSKGVLDTIDTALDTLLAGKLDTLEASATEGIAHLNSIDGGTGAPIHKNGDATNELKIVHTVTTGKVFTFTDYFIELSWSAAITGKSVTLAVRDAGDTYKWTIAEVTVTEGAAGYHTVSGYLRLPHIIFTEYDIYLESNDATLLAIAFISGWEN